MNWCPKLALQSADMHWSPGNLTLYQFSVVANDSTADMPLSNKAVHNHMSVPPLEAKHIQE